MVEAILLGLALAMDATAVSAARGVLGASRREAVVLAVAFAVFQAGMAAIGWAIGGPAAAWIAPWDRWLAFAVLAAIGGKMVWGAVRRGGNAPAPVALGVQELFALSLATSIDALAAGVTLPQIPAPPPVTLAAIGIATLAGSLAGGLGGSLLGERAGKKLEILGGLVLVGIAVKMVV